MKDRKFYLLGEAPEMETRGLRSARVTAHPGRLTSIDVMPISHTCALKVKAHSAGHGPDRC
jgi:hypothetical protein